MVISEREQNRVNEANALLKGLVFNENDVCERGNFQQEGISQSLKSRVVIKRTTYPYVRYYYISIRRRYRSLSPTHFTQYDFYVYVDDDEKITEISPLLIYQSDGRHEYRQIPTRENYADIVYRLFL